MFRCFVFLKVEGSRGHDHRHLTQFLFLKQGQSLESHSLFLGGCFLVFIIICPLGKFKSLTPSSCCIKELLDSLPSSPPLQR